MRLLFLLFISFQLQAQNHIEIKERILSKELSYIESDLIIFDYSGDKILEEFITTNYISHKDDIKDFDDLVNCLGKENYYKIFNKNQFIKYKNQLNDNEFIYLVEIPKNVKYDCYKNELFKNNLEIGIPLHTNIYEYNISSLLITEDLNFILFEYSKGLKGSKSGGIKVYKKDTKGNYNYFCEFNSWME
ncbi:hypothetical protein [Mesonia sp. K7]|uniref:hypothetical protein n=1 Tax=Mesonia sp. K7 TaxID=2218606 RepID=UPI000DA99932|nr:hypothetical protein [Mesonia sp. K7]PZD79086.1 hypothetical protein DNG35_03515 [Mesonia sp. K7]